MLEHPYTQQIRAQIVHKLQVVDGEGNILKGIPVDREGVDRLQFRFQQTRARQKNEGDTDTCQAFRIGKTGIILTWKYRHRFTN
jgi:hypothetical protein